MESKKVKGSWLVISRDFGMPGGVFDHGVANINEFFPNEKMAISYAVSLIKANVNGGLYDPYVWVLRCERTYQKTKDGIVYVYSEYKEKQKK